MAYKTRIPENQIKRCNEIIYSHADMCRGLGNQLGRIPLEDSSIIIQIQTAMIIKLAKVFNQRVGEKTAQSIIASSLVHPSNLNKFMFQWLLGWRSCMGNTISVATAIRSTKRIGFRAADRLFTEKFDEVSDDSSNLDVSYEECKDFTNSDQSKTYDYEPLMKGYFGQSE